MTTLFPSSWSLKRTCVFLRVCECVWFGGGGEREGGRERDVHVWEGVHACDNIYKRGVYILHMIDVDVHAIYTYTSIPW